MSQVHLYLPLPRDPLYPFTLVESSRSGLSRIITRATKPLNAELSPEESLLMAAEP